MELHTLGVVSGYSQHDVQQLALILTGVGIAAPSRDAPPKLLPPQQVQYLRRGTFEFNRARHQPGDKTLLGQRIAGGGFDEVERGTADRAPAGVCAFRVAAPGRIVRRRRSAAGIGGEDGAHFPAHRWRHRRRAAGAVRRAGNGRRGDAQVQGSVPLAGVVAAPGLRGADHRQSAAAAGLAEPDGRAELRTDQVRRLAAAVQRLEQFRADRARDRRRQQPVVHQPRTAARRFPATATPLYYQAIEPQLGDATRKALAQARSQQEWKAFPLASPDFNYC